MMCSHVDQDCCGLAAEQHCVLSDKPPQGSAPDQLTRFRASITPAQPEKTQETSRNGPKEPLSGQTQLYGSPLRPSLLGSRWLFARGAKSRLRAVARWQRRQQPPLTCHPAPEAWRRWVLRSQNLLSSYLSKRLSWFRPPSQPLSSSTG